MRFSLFSHLPPELRREIWETALESSSPDKEVCVFSCAEPELDGTLLEQLQVHQACSPLLWTCGESRDIALESWAARRAFDPDSDILYMGGDTFKTFIGKLCFPGNKIPQWVGRTRHFALDLRAARAGHLLPMSLENMHSLETISIVFPRSYGGMGVHAAAQVPHHGEKHVETRVLSTHETDAMSIEADYIFETYMGEHLVQWKKSATRYMQEFISGLRRDVALNTENLPACWDKENGQLLLKFEACCFI
ncbi:hypothetical protein DL766_004310 [Monosporascus sp. MC13-8B]|uniref:2EXR domain-containing protein n=1 Tax=Monosporascus cannonballus TaxID=155416 RepID=A0ABY0H8D1_9PEZI|nr:hypothetical protein DL762_005735 [Monosporascus cannonballus]RYO86345.1 hypothetical protein DL763_006732 [Monosporascus cannonballus]RYP31596.1 hypothetical protein DL766_004310 [Monosporascus sp. MC13-8B]